MFGHLKKLTKTFFKLDHTFDKRQFLNTGPVVKKLLGKALLTVIVKIQMFGSNIMSNIACGKFLKNQNTFCKNSDFHVLFGFLARVASLIKLHLLYFLFSKTHFHTFGCEYHTCQPYTNGAFCTPLGLFLLPGGSTLFWFLKCSDCPENTINTRSVFFV